ncbi:NUDIX domain-containing protein [Mesorhizobium sp. WSM2239]|uniref:NUDIX domain-containing protein n=2 Tax=unclassified Mesorhizobium TaxID=325217 RepID=A0AAU8D0W6_9HYPH
MDHPIAHTADGRPVYDNTPTVVCVLAKHRRGLITVRRSNNPGRGKLGLPGGFHMRGESWQEAGCRELKEETGYIIQPNLLTLLHMTTDEYGHNLVIARYWGDVSELPTHEVDPEEVQEVVFLQGSDVLTAEWAFPRHAAAAESVI